VSAAEDTSSAPPITDAEADALFADLIDEPVLVLAISGGPDSTALLYLAAQWRARLPKAPKLSAVTIDHGLRPESRREADAVKRLARRLGAVHRTLRWSGPKPATALQEKARAMRYRLLHGAARAAKARYVLTAHTLDDQAETVLLRMARGSGLAGIGAMVRATAIDGLLAATPRTPPRGSTKRGAEEDVVLLRPFLHVPKSRLIATLRAAGIAFAEDPSNADPRFTRARLRKLMPVLAEEGLTAHRLAHLARRVRRSEDAIETIVSWAAARCGLGPESTRLAIDRGALRDMPADIALRLIGRALGVIGDEGPVELGKLESLTDALMAAMAGREARFRRTLAGAMVSLQSRCIVIERAPARRQRGRHRLAGAK
jgi:tRNA(Ile)-lysidine synthase